MSNAVYLDYNATAPIRPQVIDLMHDIMKNVGNPSSIHRAGRKAREHVDLARDRVAALVHADRENVIFTSCGTEADNLALRGFGDRHLVVSAVEHGAVLAPSMIFDPHCAIVPVDGDGLLDLEALEAALASAQKPITASIMLANNETGVIQPIEEIASLVHDYDGLLHCDAIQAAGKIPVDINELGIDLLSLSAHKIGGPQGVGVLIMRQDMAVRASLIGGGQERGRRSGTENVAGIAGFGLAAELALNSLLHYQELERLRDDMETRVLQLAPEAQIFGKSAPRLPNTSCLTMPGVKAETQLMLFDMAGIYLSAGSACSSGKISASHVLDAMGVPDEVAMTAIRVSLGYDTVASDIDRFVESWQDIFERCGGKANAA